MYSYCIQIIIVLLTFATYDCQIPTLFKFLALRVLIVMLFKHI
jgi:hypothetical protein